MGLLTAIAGLPIAPVRGVVRLAEVIHEEAHRQLTDPAVVARRLEEIQQAWEAGELTAAERDQLEDEVLAPLQER